VRWTGQEFILIGGQSSLAGDASVAAFDPTTLKWRLLDSLPQGEVFGHSVVKIANHLLVWGGMGRNGRAPFGSTLDLHTGTWEQLSTMQQPKLRSNHTAAVIDGKMFIWGGADGSGKLNSGALYNPAIRRWTDAVITADIEPRSGHAMVTVNNGVLVWGGRDGKNHFLNDGAFFDFTLGTWSKFSPNQISARALHTLVAVNNRALLIGGFGPGEHFTLRYFGDAYWLLPPDANAEQYSFCHEESCRG
jgi:kelch-like protein 24/35